MRAVVLVLTAVLMKTSLSLTLFTIMLHVGFALLLGSALLVLWILARVAALRIAVTAIALLVLSFSLFLSVSDPILFAIIGERLVPSTLAHFAGPGLFLSDYFWKPVIAYWHAVSSALALLLLYVIWVFAQFWNVGRKPELTPMRLRFGLGGLAVGAGLSFFSITALPQVVNPVEIDYLTELTGLNGTRLGLTEEEAVSRIRDFTGLPKGAEWVDERFPLVYRWKDTAPVVSVQPDIFIFVVESMRGASLRPINPDGTQLVSAPAIEALAREGVVFRRFLSNGFPSGPGFVGISSGAWMHGVKRLDAAYKDTSFDRLGSRLRSVNYRTGIVTYDVRYDDKTNWVYDVFEDVIDCVAMGLADEDAVTAQQFINWVQGADAEPAQRPLFGIFLTKEPHLPYQWKNEAGQWTFGKDLTQNYARSFGQMDEVLAGIFTFLKSRPRWRNTVILIVGDHANFLQQGESTGLPVDDAVFTGAIIAGGDPVVGSPRVVNDPASQSDIASTVLVLAGDRRPAMALGRNLLAVDPERKPRALSIRSGGVRLDTPGSSVIFPSNAPSRVSVSQLNPDAPSGPDPERIAEAVRVWSWLIETDRVWDSKLLSGQTP